MKNREIEGEHNLPMKERTTYSSKVKRTIRVKERERSLI